MMDKPSEVTSSMDGDEKSSMWEAFLSKMKEERTLLFANDIDLNKDKKTLPKLELVSPPEVILDPRCSWTEQEKQQRIERRSRRIRRVGIVMERSLKKLEQLMYKRGLLVEKETLSPGASKDAFDLKGLNESLPSTSAQNPSDVEFRSKLQQDATSFSRCMGQSYGRFEKMNCSLSSFHSKLGRKSAVYGFLDEKNIKSPSFRPSVQRQRRKVPVEIKQIFDSDEEKEEVEDIQIVQLRQTLKILEAQEAKLKSRVEILLAGPSSEISEAPPGGELEERSFGGGANLADMKLPPCPGWDSEKIWTPEFDEPQSSVHHNSPTKWKVTFGDSKSELLFQRMGVENQRDALKKSREENKLRIVNTQRGVLCVDMDESENSISKQAVKISEFARTRLLALRDLRNTLKAPKEEVDSNDPKNVDVLKQMMRMRAKETSKTMREFRRFVLGPNKELFVAYTNPDDKVLPD